MHLCRAGLCRRLERSRRDYLGRVSVRSAAQYFIDNDEFCHLTHPHPARFLKTIYRFDEGETVGLVACAGFELGKWRAKKLAEHLINWLPNFALRDFEIDKIGPENPFKLVKEASYRVFKESASDRRGEIGELLLHIVAVTEYRAHAFVSRLFYKMRSNDQVTGFDSALVTYDEDSDEIELWLGEAKFYTNTKDAITAALKSLAGHLEEGFLEETKILVGPKIEETTPGYDKLQWLFDDRNTLDEIIARTVVPVLVASESAAAYNYNGCADTYKDVIIEEYEYICGRFQDSPLAERVRIVVIYVPLASKEELEAKFAKKLGAFQ